MEIWIEPIAISQKGLCHLKKVIVWIKHLLTSWGLGDASVQVISKPPWKYSGLGRDSNLSDNKRMRYMLRHSRRLINRSVLLQFLRE